MTVAVRNLEKVIREKDTQHQMLANQHNHLIEEKENLEEEKIKYATMIYSLRFDFSKKIEANQSTLKIQ